MQNNSTDIQNMKCVLDFVISQCFTFTLLLTFSYIPEQTLLLNTKFHCDQIASLHPFLYSGTGCFLIIKSDIIMSLLKKILAILNS